MTFKQAISKARGYALCGNKAECQKWINQAAKRGRISDELLRSIDKTLKGGIKRRAGGGRKGKKNPKTPSKLFYYGDYSGNRNRIGWFASLGDFKKATGASSGIRFASEDVPAPSGYRKTGRLAFDPAVRESSTKNPKRIRVLKGNGKCGCKGKRNPDEKLRVTIHHYKGRYKAVVKSNRRAYADYISKNFENEDAAKADAEIWINDNTSFPLSKVTFNTV